MNIASVNPAPSASGIKATASANRPLSEGNGTAPSFSSALVSASQALEGTQPPETPASKNIAGEPSLSVGSQNKAVDLLEKSLPQGVSPGKKNVAHTGSEAKTEIMTLLDLIGEQNATATTDIASVAASNSTTIQIVEQNNETTETQGIPSEANNSVIQYLNPLPDVTATSSLNTIPTPDKNTPSSTKAMPGIALSNVSNEPKTPDSLTQNDASQPQLTQDDSKANFETLIADITDSGETTTDAPRAEMQSATRETGLEAFAIPKQAGQKIELPMIAKPVGHPGWSQDLGEHIVWMNNKDISAAEIKLNPLHLGPVSVRIDIGQDNQASISFATQHVETKEALESSLPKLREMLSNQNLNLVNVNISQNSGSNHGRQPEQAFPGMPGNSNPNFETAADSLEVGESEVVVSKGLLSLYA